LTVADPPRQRSPRWSLDRDPRWLGDLASTGRWEGPRHHCGSQFLGTNRSAAV